MMLFDTARAVL